MFRSVKSNLKIRTKNIIGIYLWWNQNHFFYKANHTKIIINKYLKIIISFKMLHLYLL
jgi:hypothetical protein